MTFNEWWEIYRLANAVASATYAHQSEGEEYPMTSELAKSMARLGWEGYQKYGQSPTEGGGNG